MRQKGRSLIRAMKISGIVVTVILCLCACGQATSDEVNIEGKHGNTCTDAETPIPDNSYETDEMERLFESENWYGVRDGDRYGYLSSYGEEIIPCIYDEIYPFSEGLACVKKDGKYGYIDSEGEEALPFIYDQAAPFSEGLAYYAIGNQYGFMYRNGETAFTLDCDSVGSFQEGMASFCVDGKYGYLDHSGNVVLEPEYVMAGPFQDGQAVVLKEGFWGTIDLDGRTEGKDAREEGAADREGILPAYFSSYKGPMYCNMITPRSAAFMEYVSTQSYYKKDDETDSYAFQRMYALFRGADMEESVLIGLVNGESALTGGFYRETGSGTEEILHAHAAGSAGGFQVCLWYDEETGKIFPGLYEYAGGFRGYGSGGNVYAFQREKAEIISRFYCDIQAITNFDAEELLECPERYYSADGEPFDRESMQEAIWEKREIVRYWCGEEMTSKEVYEQEEGRYRAVFMF